MINTDPQKIDEVLTRGVAEVIDLEHLRARMLAGEQLRIKLGIDPTSANLHVGRSVTLLKLRDFQALGHTAVFIVGDETGRIGDTSDKESERPMLTEAQVSENMKNYLSQAYLILDKEKTEVHYNSEWLSKLGLMELAQMANLFSIKEFSSREVIARRLDAGQRVSLHEALYPLYQGYDSVAIKADVELGGTDQRFNLLAGRHIQPLYNQVPQDIVMTNIVAGTDGRKMSSSWGNTINFTDSPELMFKKVMDTPDEITETYFIHCTRVPMETVKELLTGNLRDAKFVLAGAIVEQFHNKEAAIEAKERYETVSQGGVPEDMKEVTLQEATGIIQFLGATELASSNSDARRKIEQGGVSLDGEKLLDPNFILTPEQSGKILKVGKNDFVKIVF
jgi:tyrosyl-tRNA synthetase